VAHEQRPSRRRRSVARTPVMVAPIDIPDDAPGRVAFIAVRAPADVVASRPSAAEAEPAPPPEEHTSPWLSEWGGWLAVALLTAALIFLFVAGMAITRCAGRERSPGRPRSSPSPGRRRARSCTAGLSDGGSSTRA